MANIINCLKKQLIIKGIGGARFQVAGIQPYVEDLKPGTDLLIGPKGFCWTATKSANAILKFILAALICFGLAGCFHLQQAGSKQERLTELSQKNASLQSALASKDEEILALGKEIVALNMKAIEYEAALHDLQERLAGHQQRLDAAIIEVVRTKARLRSLESKAEAASTIAEAEIDINALKKAPVSADTAEKEEVTAADYLLKMSIREFKNRNFGGALYLANQSKGRVRALQLRLNGGMEKAPVENEKAFANPLQLKVLSNSNLRSGPGLDNDVAGKLGKDELVTGLAYSGLWVRVETTEGEIGWLFHALVGPR